MTVLQLPSFLYASEILNHIPVLKTVLAAKPLHKTSVLYTGDEMKNRCNQMADQFVGKKTEISLICGVIASASVQIVHQHNRGVFGDRRSEGGRRRKAPSTLSCENIHSKVP